MKLRFDNLYEQFMQDVPNGVKLVKSYEEGKTDIDVYEYKGYKVIIEFTKGEDFGNYREPIVDETTFKIIDPKGVQITKNYPNVSQTNEFGVRDVTTPAELMSELKKRNIPLKERIKNTIELILTKPEGPFQQTF